MNCRPDSDTCIKNKGAQGAAPCPCHSFPPITGQSTSRRRVRGCRAETPHTMRMEWRLSSGMIPNDAPPPGAAVAWLPGRGATERSRRVLRAAEFGGAITSGLKRYIRKGQDGTRENRAAAARHRRARLHRARAAAAAAAAAAAHGEDCRLQ